MVALAAACKPLPNSTTTPPPDMAPTAKTKRVDPELSATADRLDAGSQQPPLYEVLPTWLKVQVDAALTGDPKSPKYLAEAREAIAALEKVDAKDTQAMLQGALVFARGLVLAERAVVAGSDDPELLAALTKAYREVQGLKMFQRSGLFGQLLNMAVELARKEAKVESQQVEEALAALTVVLERAPDLQRHTTARLLREHPDHPTVIEVLLRASQTEAELERWPTALELGKLAVARKGERATGPDYGGLATLCYKGFDLACADKARKAAEDRGPAEAGEDKAAAFKRQLAEIDATAEQARRVLALTDSPGLEAQIERGHLLLKLGRLQDAHATFLTLQKAHPNDARPVTGMAVLKVHRDFDFMGVADSIRGARKMTGRDRLYYEVALGTVPMRILGAVMTQAAKPGESALPELQAHFDEVLELAAGFRAFDPARAALLELLFTAAREAAPKFMADKRDAGMAVVRKLADKALALTKKFPESRDVWRMVFSTTRLLADAARARAQATAPLPASLQQDPDLRLQQARALVDIALIWEDRALLAAAAEAAASLPTEVDADTATNLRATIDAVLGLQGDKPALQRAVDAFAALAERKTGKDQATAFNNAAMVVAHGLDATTALAVLERARQADPEELVPAHNMAALAFGLQAREGLPELFATVAQRGQFAGLRVQGYAWLVALAEAGHGDVAVTRQEFAAALTKERAYDIRNRLQVGRWGVLEQAEFKVSLGYSTREGLVLLDEVVPRWWLIAPAPTMEALLAGKAKPAKPAKP